MTVTSEQDILVWATNQAKLCKEGKYWGIKALPKPVQHVYTTYWVETEVNNGGFDQYFYNYTGEFAYEAVEGYQAIGAYEHARLVEEAIRVFLISYPDQRKYDHKGYWVPHTHRHVAEFDKLDKRFYELQHKMSSSGLREKYIQSNQGAFALK